TSQRVKDGHARIMNASVQMIRDRQNELTGYNTALEHALTLMINDKESRFRRTAALLDAYSPLKILGRGYSVTLKDGKAVTGTGQVNPGDQIETLVAEGRIISEVTGVKPKENI
ncbi:MAG: exodeoxyribonuclease VII large subunit, partial [Erysipelotrichaceae bacterium]|nr:exodeoxyribonuclease VII large subunit [Erysipelotrichaceae bacterium]